MSLGYCTTSDFHVDTIYSEYKFANNELLKIGIANLSKILARIRITCICVFSLLWLGKQVCQPTILHIACRLSCFFVPKGRLHSIATPLGAGKLHQWRILSHRSHSTKFVLAFGQVLHKHINLSARNIWHDNDMRNIFFAG